MRVRKRVAGKRDELTLLALPPCLAGDDDERRRPPFRKSGHSQVRFTSYMLQYILLLLRLSHLIFQLFALCSGGDP